MPATKCFAKDPSKCRYHGKPDGLRPGKNMAEFQRLRLAADFDAAQRQTVAKATGKKRADAIEEIKADAVVDMLAEQDFFKNMDEADDEAQSAKKWVLDPNGGDAYVNYPGDLRVSITRDAHNRITHAQIAYARETTDSEKWSISDANYRLNARLQNPTAMAKDLPHRPITLYSREMAVDITSAAIRETLGGGLTQSHEVAARIYDQTFNANEPARRGEFWQTQQTLWVNYSGGGATAAATAEIYTRLMIPQHIPENWQNQV